MKPQKGWRNIVLSVLCSRPVHVAPLLLSVVFLFHEQCFTLAHTSCCDGVIVWMYDAAPLTQYYSPGRTTYFLEPRFRSVEQRVDILASLQLIYKKKS
jgi:hypothetical protein